MIYGYQFGPQISNRNDDPIGFLDGDTFPVTPETVENTIQAMGWRRNPGIFIANWLQVGAHEAACSKAVDNVQNLPAPLHSYRPLIHSVKGFKLPSIEIGASQGHPHYFTKVVGVRPLASLPEGRLVSTKLDIVKNKKKLAEGKSTSPYFPLICSKYLRN